MSPNETTNLPVEFSVSGFDERHRLSVSVFERKGENCDEPPIHYSYSFSMEGCTASVMIPQAQKDLGESLIKLSNSLRGHASTSHFLRIAYIAEQKDKKDKNGYVRVSYDDLRKV